MAFAPGSSYDGIPYGVVILGPVAALVLAALIVAGAGQERRSTAAWVTMLLGAGLATLALTLAAGESGRVLHTGLRGQTLLVLGMLGGGVFAGGRLAGLSGRRAGPFIVLVAVAVAAMVEADVRLIDSIYARDLLLYLRAGAAMLHGLPVYSDAVLTQAPADPTLLPFVYPPVTLPFLAVLALLPTRLVELAWLGLGVGASVAALRCFGVRWAWVPIVLLWPPFIQGFWTGNANTFLLLAFAAAPYAPALLAVPPLVKLQLGLTGLWLPRERRWRALAQGLAAVVILVVATLPFVGVGAWHDWLGAQSAFAQTTANIRPIQGLALTRFVGPLAAVGLGLVILAIALLRTGRDGLATLGLASMAISPTLYLHGLTPALAGLFRLRGAGLWFLLAVTASFSHGQNWWQLVAIVVIAPGIPGLLAADGADAVIHPISRAGRPGAISGHEVWPGNPFSRSGRQQ